MRVMVQIKQDGPSWEQGRKAGEKGLPSDPPKGVDALAFASGYVEGQAIRDKRSRLQPVRAGDAPGNG
jgi:hypothetical protein